MPESIPGYDAWKLQADPRLEGAPNCTRCGHEYDDHIKDGDGELPEEHEPDGFAVCAVCYSKSNGFHDCPGYLASDAEQEAEDAAIRRWERRREERE